LILVLVLVLALWFWCWFWLWLLRLRFFFTIDSANAERDEARARVGRCRGRGRVRRGLAPHAAPLTPTTHAARQTQQRMKYTSRSLYDNTPLSFALLAWHTHTARHLARNAKQRHRTRRSGSTTSHRVIACHDRFSSVFSTRAITTQVWIHDEPIAPHYDSSLLFSFSTDDYVLNRTGRARIGEVEKRHRNRTARGSAFGLGVEWKEVSP
jgi:hypothetical protein